MGLLSRIFKKKPSFSNEISKQIFHVLKKNINKTNKILEVGSGSCHISIELSKIGFDISGIEIREKCVEDIRNKFFSENLSFNLIHGDILLFNEDKKYDILWNSGLIQCLPDDKKRVFFSHFVKIAKKCIFFVPERNDYLAPDKPEFEVGVAGCEEFPTGMIPYILSDYYDVVHVGIIPKEKINMPFNFLYYICKNN